MAKQTGTTYEQFVDTAWNMGFFDDIEEAESAVKMVLGIAASRLQEKPARALTDELPDPLTYEKLRSHQATPTEISAAQYVEDVAREFGVSDQDAREIIQTIWSQALNSMSDDKVGQIVRGFPSDWRALLEPAHRSPGIWG